MATARHSTLGRRLRVGVVGTGFVGRRLVEALSSGVDGVDLSGVLSRRPAACSSWLDAELHTSSVERLADRSDLLVEVSGDAAFAAEICLAALERGVGVVTLNSEFHVTVGSFFVGRMFLTEGLGDQPGCSAALHRKALDMGFAPLAHINYKGFLNHNPSPQDMAYWAAKQDLSVAQTTSFTDGTKLQIEQTFLANGLGLDIAREGLLGGEIPTHTALQDHARAAEALGAPIADFASARDAPPGVALAARHDLAIRTPEYTPFKRLMTPEGPYYVLVQPYHLIHFELAATLADLARTPSANWRPLLDNGPAPRIGVAALVKRPMRAGETIARAAGGFDTRGVAVRIAERPDHVPICLLDGATLLRPVEPGQILGFDDVDLVPTTALDLHLALRSRSPVQGSVRARAEPGSGRSPSGAATVA